jgi:YkoY family integral membrane protein
MLGQTFDLFDIARVSALTFLEILLSADNTVVLALLIRDLPETLRRKALYIGLVSAFFLRAGAIFLAAFILHWPWVEVLGGIYLIYLAIRHFIKKETKKISHSPTSFWKTVLLIECFDLAFALDSIVAGIAFIAAPAPTFYSGLHPKIWIVYIGGMIGLVVIRYAADACSSLIDRFPYFEKSAYLLVGLIGFKLILEVTVSPLLLEYLFWGAFALIFGFSFIKSRKKIN